MYRTLSMLVESHYAHFVQANRDYLTETTQILHQMIAKTDQTAKNLTGASLENYLIQQNYAISNRMREETMKAIATCVTSGLELSKLTFDMDKNL